MGNTLILAVPTDVYEPLAKTAKQKGRTREELAIELLTANLHQATDDPVESFIGVFDSHIADWANEHDKHLGQSLLQEMQSKGKNNDSYA